MSSNRFCGKIALVTASTHGMCFAIAQRLAREGATVIVSSRKAKNVEEATNKLVCEGLKVIGMVCHVGKKEDRKKVFDEAKKLGGLDILVSGAAFDIKHEHVLDCSESDWDTVFDVNVKSSFMLAKEALPLLRKSKAGRIIFISSVVGTQPMALLGPYSVSKTALLGLVKTAALQLAPEQITVNSICPGIIETKFAEILTEEKVRKKFLAIMPIGRFGKPEDISGIAAYLASDEASFLTGENIVVAGGMTSRL